MSTTSSTTATNKEDAKNMALLFFMDHLMQKNGVRTIHDLSCQFGARGFTEEMREAVGTTQEGLCEFLRQFPSLFTITDGDTVSVNGFGDLASGGAKAGTFLQTFARDRDVEREAVEFFQEKLRKFGPELQVKALLGHRSQAPPEIRLLSGRHVKEFTEFLRVRGEFFVVEGDRVRLRNIPEPANPDLGLDENGEPLSGVRAKQAAVEYLKKFVESQEAPVPMETLYRQFCARSTNQVRQEVATNPKELLQFLKLNRHIFFIRSNKVSIVRNRPASSGTNEETDSGTGISSPAPCSSPGATGTGTGTGSGSTTTNSSVVDGTILQQPQQHLLDTTTSCSSRDSPNTTSSMAAGNNFSSSWDPMESTILVKSLKQAQAAMQEVASLYVDRRCPLPPELANVVAVDFKLVNLGGAQEFLTLVVVGTPTGLLYVFDVAHSASILLESGLKDLLEADDYIKVIHDCKKVCALLSKQYQIEVKEVFDTQVANTVLQHQRTSRPLHEIKAVSFLTLQRLYHPQSLMLSDSGPRKTQKRDHRYWSTRPLTDEMIRVAVEEAHVLVPTIYCCMNSALKPELRDMFRNLCRENVEFFINQEEVQSQRRERRNRFTMGVINEKLQYDPSGLSLSSRERKLLSSVEREERISSSSSTAGGLMDLVPPAILANGNTNPMVVDITKPPPSFPPPNQYCQCQCSKAGAAGTGGVGGVVKKIFQDSSTQTLSTGDITIQNVFEE